MGELKSVSFLGVAMAVIGGIGVLSALYSIGFWLVSLRETFWMSRLHMYTFEWGYLPDYIAMCVFCAIGARLGGAMVQCGPLSAAGLELLGKWGVLVWGFLAAISVGLLAGAVLINQNFFNGADAMDLILADPLPTLLWPPEEHPLGRWTYSLRWIINDPSPNPAWLLLDLILSQTFWILGPLAISLWAWRGRKSNFADRAFAGLALIFAFLTIVSIYLLIKNNWSMMTYDYPNDLIVHFAEAPGFGAIPFYLTFVLMMLAIALLLFQRTRFAGAKKSEVGPT